MTGCSNQVYRTPPSSTKSRPALSLDTFLTPSDRSTTSMAGTAADPAADSKMFSPKAFSCRRPSLFNISNITPPPTEMSYFSDPSSTPTKENRDELSLTTPPPAPRSSRKDLSTSSAAADTFDLDMGRALFISSPQPRRPNLVSFLSFTPSPFLPDASFSSSTISTSSSHTTAMEYYSSPESPRSSLASTTGHSCWDHHRSSSSSGDNINSSPSSPVLHIKLGTTPSGAAQPMVQPKMPGLHQKACRYDYEAKDLAAQLDQLFGASVLPPSKSQRLGQGGVDMARTASSRGFSPLSETQPLLASPRSPSHRQHLHAHHPYAHHTQRKNSSKRKHRPPPLDLQGFSALEPRSRPSKRPRPSLSLQTSGAAAVVSQGRTGMDAQRPLNPIDAEIHVRQQLLPSLMPAHGPESGVKRKMSLKNMLSFPSRLRSGVSLSHKA